MARQTLPADGREDMFWEVGTDATTVQVQFPPSDTWHPLTALGSGRFKLLCAGPLATDNPTGTVVLPNRLNPSWVRFTSGTEVVIRPSRRITIINRELQTP